MKKLILLFVMVLLVMPMAFADIDELIDSALLLNLPDGNVNTDSSSYGTIIADGGGVTYDTTTPMVRDAELTFDGSDATPLTVTGSSAPYDNMINQTACIVFDSVDNDVNYADLFRKGTWNTAGSWEFEIISAAASSNLRFNYFNNALTQIKAEGTSTIWTDGTPKLICGVLNHTNGVTTLQLIVNKTIFNEGSNSDTFTISTGDIIMGGDDSGNDNFAGTTACYGLWNRSLTTEEITSIWTQFDAGTCFEATSQPINNTKPNITINYPTNASTIGNTTDYPLLIYGISEVQNGTLNVTINNTNWKNIGNHTNFNFTMNGTIVEGIKFFNITSISEYGNQTSTILQFTLDFTEPILKSTLSGNDTLIYAYQNLTYNVNATDSEKVYLFNITTPEGYSVQYTGVNTTKYLYNGSINVSDYGIGKHTLTALTCDAHTKNKIKDWEEVIGEDKRITYDFDNDYLFIRPLDPTAIEEVTTNKLEDRYSFTYKKNPLNKKEDFNFIVSSSQYIDIIGNTNKYSGWLVIPKLKKWIDFNTDDKKKLKYTITRLSDYSVAIEIKGIKDDEFTFNSAGSLNCISKDYAYYIYNYTVSYDDRATSLQPTTLDLSITYKDIFLNSTALINWNETTYTPINISSINQFNYTINITPQQYATATKNINHTWNYTINNTLYLTLNYTQTIDSVFLNYHGNLSNASAINFTFWDETNNTNLTANINGDFNYLTSSIFSPDLTDTTNLTIAIYPSSASTTGDYTVYYSKTGYPERRYNEPTAIYNNNTQVIKLYLLALNEGAYTTFQVIDSYSNALEGVKGKMQKLIDGTLTTVEQQESDGSGIMTFFVDPDDDYTFSFSKTGYVTFTTTIRPITTEIYTVTLESEGVDVPPSYATEVTYSFSPSNTVLNNATGYNFMFNLSSGYWDITDCTLNLKNDTETLATSSTSYDIRNCDISIALNTGNQTTIIAEAIYELNGSITETVIVEYTILYTYEGEFSLMNFIDDLRGFNGAGFNSFTLMFITFIFIFSIVAFASSQLAGLRDPETLIILTWGLVMFFSYIGFLTVDFAGIPDIAGVGQAWLQQYIIAILISLGAGSYIIKRHL